MDATRAKPRVIFIGYATSFIEARAECNLKTLE